MKQTREDNTVGIIQRVIRYFRIKVINSSVKEILKSHPDYPSFKSICDTFNELHIENYPIKYATEEILELKAPYIVHFNNSGGQIGFVTKVDNEVVTCFESYGIKSRIETKKYLERCSGAVILVNPNKNSGEKYYKKKWQNEMINNAILPMGLFAFILLIAHSLISYIASGGAFEDKILITLFLTRSIGILLSTILVLHEFEVHWSLTDKLCHLNKATNCNTVLENKASKVFGWFGWADIGFIYFTGGLIFLLHNLRGAGFPIIAIAATLSVPYSLFSVYYQGFVLKKWCPICLGVQIILVMEFILLLPQFAIARVTYDIFLRFIFTYLLTVLIYILIILFNKERISNENQYFKYLEIKKDPNILRILLFNQTHYEIPITKYSLIFGDRHATLRITAFLSLCCIHCAKTFEKIAEILNNNEPVLINIVLKTSDNKILTSLNNYQRQNNGEKALKLLDQWFKGDPYSRTKILKDLSTHKECDILGSKIGEENLRLFKLCKVQFTPTFIVNGHKLPPQYDLDDFRYFKGIFIEKKEILIDTNKVK